MCSGEDRRDRERCEQQCLFMAFVGWLCWGLCVTCQVLTKATAQCLCKL
jgi:hypothetical protein